MTYEAWNSARHVARHVSLDVISLRLTSSTTVAGHFRRMRSARSVYLPDRTASFHRVPKRRVGSSRWAIDERTLPSVRADRRRFETVLRSSDLLRALNRHCGDVTGRVLDDDGCRSSICRRLDLMNCLERPSLCFPI